MDISTFLKLTIMTVIITFVFTQILDNKEKLYLDVTAPLTKKLMVVDQTTGAISFLNDSVKGIDDKFAASDTTQMDHLKSLFGPELDGAGGVFATKLQVVADRVEAVDTALDGRITTAQTTADGAIQDGSPFAIQIDVDTQGWDTGKIIRGFGGNNHTNATHRNWMDGDIWVATAGDSKMRILKST